MRFILLMFLIGSIFCGWTNALSIRGASSALSKFGKKFGNAKNYLDDIEHVGDLAGYNFAALGTYWRSNTLAAFAQMKRGEIEESKETLNLAMTTLAVWDLGQGVAYLQTHQQDRTEVPKRVPRNCAGDERNESDHADRCPR